MKRVVLLALLVAAALTASAQAQVHEPSSYQYYTCSYSNPTMQEKSPGLSLFKITPYFNHTLWRGIEDFEATHQWLWDNRKVSFFDPVDVPKPTDPDVIVATRWTFTVDPSGPRCTVVIRNFGKSLNFTGCTDGSSRFCTRN
jgi:hypothetical protein